MKYKAICINNSPEKFIFNKLILNIIYLIEKHKPNNSFYMKPLSNDNNLVDVYNLDNSFVGVNKGHMFKSLSDYRIDKINKIV